MAERLPRYRPLGAVIPTVPGVDYTRAANAEARVFDTVSEALSKMSDFAFERQKSQTQRDAQQYAFENPITIEQLEAAKKKGVDLDDHIGDPDTVFGATLRATTGQMLRADLEGDYRIEIGRLTKIIESPNFDPLDPDNGLEAITKSLGGMEEGYFSAISDVSPDDALAFKATVATLGSGVYKTAIEQINKKQILANRINAQTQVDAFPANVRALVSSFSGSVEELNEQIETASGSLKSSLFNTGDITFAQTEIANIDEIVTTAKVDVLSAFAASDEFATTEIGRATKLRNGDVGRYSAIWNTLSEQEKATVRVNMRTEMTARKTEDDRKQQDDDDILATSVAEIGQRLSDPTITAGTIETDIESLYLIAQQTSGRVISVQTIRALEKDLEEGVVSNYPGNLQMRQAIAKGIVTRENFDEKLAEFGVTAKDGVTIFTNLLTTDRQVENDVLKIAKRTAGVLSDVQQINDAQASNIESFMRNVNVKLSTRITEWEAGGKVGPKPTRLLAAQNLQAEFIASGYTKDIDASLSAVNATISQYTAFELTETTTDQEIEELVFEGIEDKVANRLRADLRATIARVRAQAEQRSNYF